MGQYRLSVYAEHQIGLQIDWSSSHIGISILFIKIIIGLEKHATGIRFFKWYF